MNVFFSNTFNYNREIIVIVFFLLFLIGFELVNQCIKSMNKFNCLFVFTGNCIAFEYFLLFY